jgi:hypothetical protein
MRLDRGTGVKFWSKEYGVINTKNASSAFLSEMGRRGAEAKHRNQKMQDETNEAFWKDQRTYHGLRYSICEGFLVRLPCPWTDGEMLECDFCGKQTEVLE